MIPATKLAVIQALDELCNTRSFERVGVVDIAKRAGISRSSFYYHFSSRNDVVRYLSRFAFAQGIDRIGHGLTWFEGHYTTTRILYPYRSLIIAAAVAQGDDGQVHPRGLWRDDHTQFLHVPDGHRPREPARRGGGMKTKRPCAPE